VLYLYGVDVIAKCRQQIDQGGRQVFIQLDLDATSGIAGNGRSSSAEAAPKAITARTSSALMAGKSAVISSMLAPSARLASSVRSVTRVPLMGGLYRLATTAAL
jgi:hypothetical protein